MTAEIVVVRGGGGGGGRGRGGGEKEEVPMEDKEVDVIQMKESR